MNLIYQKTKKPNFIHSPESFQYDGRILTRIPIPSLLQPSKHPIDAIKLCAYYLLWLRNNLSLPAYINIFLNTNEVSTFCLEKISGLQPRKGKLGQNLIVCRVEIVEFRMSRSLGAVKHSAGRRELNRERVPEMGPIRVPLRLVEYSWQVHWVKLYKARKDHLPRS